MKTNLFNTNYSAPETKVIEVELEETLLQTSTGNSKVGAPGAAGADGEWNPITNNGGDF